jgi:hypothetical protein
VRDENYPSVAPLELAAIGRILFGIGWRSELAQALGASETDVVMVESGRAPAPGDWRGKLVTLAQDHALKALEAANNLLAPRKDAALAPHPPLYA